MFTYIGFSWTSNQKINQILLSGKLPLFYGLVIRSLKRELWKELDNTKQNCSLMWVLCGDFNVIHNRSKKSGNSFDITTSKFFNAFMTRHNLVEHKLANKKFTLSNGRSLPLLDSIFTSFDWNQKYASSYIQDISSFGSDHCPILLHTSNIFQHIQHTFRFDPSWVEVEEFNRLVEKWWDEFHLNIFNLGTSQNDKLKFIRRKCQDGPKIIMVKKRGKMPRF